MSIGKHVLKCRKAAGLSQADLAEKTLLSLRTIQRIENDKNTPRSYTIRVLAEALGTQPETLTEEKVTDNRMLLKRIASINLAVLSMMIIPFGNLIFPVFLWNRYAYNEVIDQAGRNIINFQITWSLITYSLLVLSPFANDWLGTTFPIIFAVLTAGLVTNISVVLRTASRIRSENYLVSKWSLRLL